MKLSFYPKIAFQAIKKNKKLYVPYLITSITIIAMFYIMLFISTNKAVAMARSGSQLQLIISLGVIVIGLFAVLFMFYTNSFLTKRRKQEFGLYHVLGMSKANLAVVLLFETLIISFISLVVGLLTGGLFSKLSELVLMRLIKADVTYDFTIDLPTLVITAVFFIGIFTVIYIANVISISLNNSIELVKNTQIGEKPPKANWLFAVIGLILLCFAYYTSLNINDAATAIVIFFFAVLVVIIATYLLFISGSVLLCKLLQGNKEFYYKTKNFISVSMMSFRMKRNGAGLATICILSTMVLVMISSSSSLYYGVDQSIEQKYPYQFSVEHCYSDIEILQQNRDDIDNLISEVSNENDVNLSNYLKYISLPVNGRLQNDVLYIEKEIYTALGINNNELYTINFISLSDYNRICNQDIKLENGQAIIFKQKAHYNYDYLNIDNKIHYQLITTNSDFLPVDTTTFTLFDEMIIVVNDFAQLSNDISLLLDDDFSLCYHSCFDSDLVEKKQIEFDDILSARLLASDCDCDIVLLDSKASAASDFYSTYGALFFIGIILSIVFIFTTVLIIYYKQIFEGYEDQNRFKITKQLGMQDCDIRKTINAQMVIVFVSPIVLAICHLACSYPLIRTLLSVFQLSDERAFITAIVVCVIAYLIVYFGVYKLTSNTYYSIVNAKDED